MRDQEGTTSRSEGASSAPDPSDARRLAEALHLSDQRLHLALDSAQLGLWDIDLATMTRTESPTMGPLFGRPVGQVHPNVAAWRREVHPDDLPRITRQFEDAQAGLCEYHVQYRTLGADGVTRWIEARGRMVRDGAGKPTRMVGVASDISDARRAAAEREQLLLAEREARRQAETASRSKDQFLAVLSHELRTPLTPVLTLAQMLEKDPALPGPVREVAATIRRNVELEARLIDDLLDLTRISRGKLLVHLSDVDVHEKIKNVAQICQADVRSEQLDLQLELTAANHFVRADSARLQQVLWNLLKNAVKFTPAGGRIIIRTENAGADSLIIRVIDTGIGIRPENLASIFKPFEQGDPDTTRLFGGLGLGLTISRALANAHGGELTAQSDGESKGATFTLRLPALIAPAVASSKPLDLPAIDRDRRPPRILLVEDHHDTGTALKLMLSKFGYDIHIATSVASALQVAQAEPMDLLISDLGLPDGTGHDLMRQLLSRFAIRGIALSGYGMEEDVRKSHQAGFVEHLTKPIDVERLRAVIDRVMHGGDDIAMTSVL